MSQQIRLSRRSFMATSASFAGLTLSGCASAVIPPEKKPAVSLVDMGYRQMYGAIHDEQFPIPAVNLSKVDAKYYRQEVNYSTSEPVGTVIVNTKTFYLYHVQENGTAMRYGVGLGRAGFEWSGRARIGWKQEWPKWTPPGDMIARLPELEKYSAANGGMPPGINNPLGARALYIFKGRKDTLYRLHGTIEDFSIGRAVSSGCVRLLNQDVIDLYQRVPTGSKILVV